MTQNVLLTCEEVSELTRIHVRRLTHLIAEGVLTPAKPASRRGVSALFDVENLKVAAVASALIDFAVNVKIIPRILSEGIVEAVFAATPGDCLVVWGQRGRKSRVQPQWRVIKCDDVAGWFSENNTCCSLIAVRAITEAISPPPWIAEAIAENERLPQELRASSQFSPNDWWWVDFRDGSFGPSFKSCYRDGQRTREH